MLPLGVDLSRGAERSSPLAGAALAHPLCQVIPPDRRRATRKPPTDSTSLIIMGAPLETWLESKGFKFEEAAKNPDALKLSVQDGALILEAKERLRGFLFKDSMEIKNFSKVRLEWGILKYPEGLRMRNIYVTKP